MPLTDSRWIDQARKYLSGEVTAHATTVLAALVRHYGLEFLNWDPSTVEKEVEEDFSVELSSEVFDKIMAATTVVTTDRVYRDVGLFDEVVNSFVDLGLSEDEEAPTVEEIALTVAEIYLLDPAPEVRDLDAGRWHHDIRRYCRVVLDDEGMSYAPRVLDFVNDREVLSDEHHLAESIAEQESRRKEIDMWVDQQVMKIADELSAVGIDISEIE